MIMEKHQRSVELNPKLDEAYLDEIWKILAQDHATPFYLHVKGVTHPWMSTLRAFHSIGDKT